MRTINLHYRRLVIVGSILLTCTVTLYVIAFGKRGSREYQWNDLDDVGFYVETQRPLDRTGDHYIDPFESLILYDVQGLKKFRGKVCREQRNFVFIKPMKCATQTMVQILRRFGYTRELNFVLPRRDNIYFGWPYIMNDDDYRKSEEPFNILVDHAIYNKPLMSKLMPNGTVYISILREPWSHVKSTFNYFNLGEIAKVDGEDQFTEYFENIDMYEPFYKSHEAAAKRYCIPDGFSVTKNLLSHCLGMPLGFPKGHRNITKNINQVKAYIKYLDDNFILIMLMEYFNESLVLLKRLMCWSFKDIVYHAENVRNYTNKNNEPESSRHLQKFHKYWSNADYMLYDYFNKTLWRKIRKLGHTDFTREVREFTAVQNKITRYCADIPAVTATLVIKDSRYTEGFIVTPDFCILLRTDLLPYLRRRFERVENQTDPDSAPKRTC